ncbi:MAG TPA: type II toxin-antitoxin system RelE/ParE family toxin [Candidatus Elarobacter sp.]|jgi:plasmid stabilization system protein ParE|nr:type II toxin-antitoxin system RelE/ParE family toxin [Candidatus Elarobacter sp.]
MAAVFTERASEQLEAIVLYIARSSPQNARGVLARIESAVAMLDANPKLGTQRPDLSDVSPPLRTWFVSPVVLVYLEAEHSDIHIIAVAHGRQILETLLGEAP